MSTATLYVYQIRARDDGRVVYIGQGSLRRCGEDNRRGTAVGAFIEAGLSLPVEIIAGPMPRADTWRLEIEMVAKHGRVADGGTLLNIAPGGPGRAGMRHSAETRAKMSNVQRGRKFSAETIAKRKATRAANRIEAALVAGGIQFLPDGVVLRKAP
jgi:hypothetical protein